jgi:RNA polymerase sigma factor (sigma-70 family)
MRNDHTGDSRHAVSTAGAVSIAPAAEAKGLMPDTRWSLVQRSQSEEDPKALGELMKIYWRPLYSLAVARGLSSADAEDAVQSFYEMLIRRRSFDSVSAERGRLRTFFRTLFERHLIDLWSKSSAAKRGGGRPTLSLDDETEVSQERTELSHSVTADILYQRAWVTTLLARVMDALGDRYRRRGKEDIFEALKGVLEGHATEFSYAEAGEKLGINENAVKQAVFRLRKKFGEMLVWEVAQTVKDPADIDSELRELLGAVGN